MRRCGQSGLKIAPHLCTCCTLLRAPATRRVTPLRRYMRDLLQTLVAAPVQSLDEASYPLALVRVLGPGRACAALKPTADLVPLRLRVQDGTPQPVCFRRLFVCNSSDVVNVWQFGKHVAQQYGGGSLASTAAPAAGSTASAREVQVIFHQREWAARTLLQLSDLLASCSGTRVPLPGGGTATLRCEAAAVPSVAESVRVAQRADVLVSVHGASMAGAWFARPGTAVIEVVPFQAGRFPYAEMTREVRCPALPLPAPAC